MEKNLKSFKDLTNSTNILYYRSSDLKNTSIYFTDDFDKKFKEAFFELIIFQINYDYFYFLKYPNEDHFVKVKCSGKSSIGNMESLSMLNVFKDIELKRKFEILIHDKNALIKFYSKFNFLTLMSKKCDKDNFNTSLIDNIFSKSYIDIPDSIRSIQYCYKFKSYPEKYILVDYPKYNFKYPNHTFYYIENEKVSELKIEKFNRAKDGGSTWINVNLNGVSCEMFSPSPFNKNDYASFDGDVLLETSEEERLKLISLLKINAES